MLIRLFKNGLGLVQWAGIVEALGIIAKSGSAAGQFYDVVANGGGMGVNSTHRHAIRRNFQSHLLLVVSLVCHSGLLITCAAATPLFVAQAKKILSGDMSFAAFLRIGAKDIRREAFWLFDFAAQAHAWPQIRPTMLSHLN